MSIEVPHRCDTPLSDATWHSDPRQVSSPPLPIFCLSQLLLSSQHSLQLPEACHHVSLCVFLCILRVAPPPPAPAPPHTREQSCLGRLVAVHCVLQCVLHCVLQRVLQCALQCSAVRGAVCCVLHVSVWGKVCVQHSCVYSIVRGIVWGGYA